MRRSARILVRLHFDLFCVCILLTHFIIERASFGVKSTVLDDLLTQCSPPSMPILFVHNVAFAMAARLGDFKGLSFEEPLGEHLLLFDETIDIKQVWGHRLDTRLRSARVEGDHPSGFFGAVLRGIFGMKKPCAGDVLAVRKRVVTLLLEKWRETTFRTIVWGLPEMNKYRDGRVRFLLESMVRDWLGQGSTHPEIGRLAIDLCARAFNVQIGVVRVDKTRNPGMTVYGDFTRPKVYIACNGLQRHHQKFYFFIKGSETNSFMTIITVFIEAHSTTSKPVAGSPRQRTDISERSTIGPRSSAELSRLVAIGPPSSSISLSALIARLQPRIEELPPPSDNVVAFVTPPETIGGVTETSSVCVSAINSHILSPSVPALTPREPSPTSPRAPSPTTPRAPAPTTPRDPSPTSPHAPSPTTPRAPSPTSPRAPSPTAPRVPSLTAPRVPSPTSPHAPAPTIIS